MVFCESDECRTHRHQWEYRRNHNIKEYQIKEIIIMISLERGFLAITDTEYALMHKTNDEVRAFCANVGINEDYFRNLKNNADLDPFQIMASGVPNYDMYVEFALMQALSILSYVAVNSDKGIDKQIGELRIGIRCSNNPMDIHEPCYIDINGVNVFQIRQDIYSEYTWSVYYMDPGLIDFTYALQSIIKVSRL